MSALREQHPDIEIESAKQAWTALDEAVNSPPLVNKMYAKGSLSEAWAILEEWYAPREVVTEEEWTPKYEDIDRTE